jgi:GGDEF domain-containing protein
VKPALELLKKVYHGYGFIGHIGGDDFFIGLIKNVETRKEILLQAKDLIDRFSYEISQFYSNEEIMNGYYISKDRNGELKKFDLLSVSIAIVEICKDAVDISQDDISSKLASLKKEAKNSKEKIAFLLK